MSAISFAEPGCSYTPTLLLKPQTGDQGDAVPADLIAEVLTGDTDA